MTWLLHWLADSQAQQQQRQQQLFEQMASHQPQLLQQMADLILAAIPQGPTIAGNVSPALQGTTLTLKLPKMKADNDLESFLVVLKRVAQASQWPPDQWAILFAPFLTGNSQHTGDWTVQHPRIMNR